MTVRERELFHRRERRARRDFCDTRRSAVNIGYLLTRAAWDTSQVYLVTGSSFGWGAIRNRLSAPRHMPDEMGYHHAEVGNIQAPVHVQVFQV